MKVNNLNNLGRVSVLNYFFNHFQTGQEVVDKNISKVLFLLVAMTIKFCMELNYISLFLKMNHS